MIKKSDDYVEGESGWSLATFEEAEEVEDVEETDDAPEEAEVAPAPDPVEEAPAPVAQGVVYRRLPNGALVTD